MGSSSTGDACVVTHCWLVGVAVWFNGTVFSFRAVVRPYCLDARSYGAGRDRSPAILPTAHLSAPYILRVPSGHVQHRR